MRLIGVEWLRLRSRQMALIVALVAVAGMALALVGYARSVQPVSDSERAQAVEQAKQEAQQPWVQQQVQECLDAHANGDMTDMYPPDMDCQDMVPQPEWFLDSRTANLVGDLREAAGQVGVFGGLAALIIGVSSMGADWAAGVVGTQLLFEPRRRRLLTAKVAVGAMAGAGIGLALTVVTTVGTWVIAAMWGTTSGIGAASGSLLLQALRIIVLIAAAGAGGVAVVAAIRSSVGMLGLVVGYLFLGEGLLRNLWHNVEPWLLSSQVASWVQGGHDIYMMGACESSPNGGSSCEGTTYHISLGVSAIYLAIFGALVVVASFATFARRDVP